ncbi:MAG: hypothetical protein ACFB6R_08105 [Alphaproteobacteria bacterium]
MTGHGINRRVACTGLIGATATLAGGRPVLAQQGGSAGAPVPPMDGAQLYKDVVTYDGFGWHRSGSRGDRQTAIWVGSRLGASGFTVDYDAFEVPAAEVTRADITIGDDAPVTGHAQWPLTFTGPDGLEAPLGLFEPYAPSQALAGRIAVFPLPYRRHSSLMQPALLGAVNEAVEAGAVGVVLVPFGPSGTVIALNAPVSLPGIAIPLLTLAPRDADPVLKAAGRGARARLTVDGPPLRTGSARNIRAEIKGQGPAIVVSTPLSGWFHCAAERGPGIAVFLALAERLPAVAPGRRMIFVANSGHELENAGAAHLLEKAAPPPEETVLWVHLGAGLAARGVFELSPPRLLPSADSQRYLLGTEDLVSDLRRAFAGLAGLEAVLPASPDRAAGELRNVLEAGYTRAFGAFGGHPFHHSPQDRADKTRPEILEPMGNAFLKALEAILPRL